MNENGQQKIAIEHIKLDTNVADALNRVYALKAVQGIMEYCSSFEVTACNKCMFFLDDGCMFGRRPDEWNISEVLGNG